jgi:hypothetical protein
MGTEARRPSTKEAKAVKNTGTPESFVKPKEMSHLFSRLKPINTRRTAHKATNPINFKNIKQLLKF